MCAYVYMYFTNMCICIAIYVYNCVHIEWPRWQAAGYRTRCWFLYMCAYGMGILIYVYKCVRMGILQSMYINVYAAAIQAADG